MYESTITQVALYAQRINRYTAKSDSAYSDVKGLMSELIARACMNDLRTANYEAEVQVREYKNKIYLEIGGRNASKKYIEINAIVKDVNFDLDREIAYELEVAQMEEKVKDLRGKRDRMLLQMSREIEEQRNKKLNRIEEIKREKKYYR